MYFVFLKPPAARKGRLFFCERLFVKKEQDVVAGSIVQSGWQAMIVLSVDGSGAVACPLVHSGEPAHRADVALQWHELAGSGLSRVDMRCRAIACARRVSELRVLGGVEEGVRRRVQEEARREQARRNCEGGPPPRGTRRARPSPVRAVWLGGESMMSRREAGLMMR